MMRLVDIKDKHVLLLGYGREGKATHEVLKAQVPSAKICVFDDKQTNEDVSWVALEDIEKKVDQSWVVIKTPGIPPHHQAVQAVVKTGASLTTAMNLFFAERKGKGKIIGITGTKGKSTTSSLLAHVLKIAGKHVVLAGNIGDPALRYFQEPEETIFVLEMSSYHCADLEIAPDIAVIINLYEEHMDWHGNVEQYHAAKMRLAELQTSSDTLVYSVHIPKLVELAGRVKSQTIPFVEGEESVLNALSLLGEHNRENARAVLAVTDLLGIDREKVHEAFSTFVALPHRLQDVGAIKGIQFINDSFCTTPAATLAAMEVFGEKLGALILGGHDRGYHFEELAKHVVQSGVRVYILKNGDRLAEAIRQAGGSPIIMHDFYEIVHDVVKNVEPGKVCVLSPASPSFGQFKNFVERGELFMQAVLRVRGEL